MIHSLVISLGSAIVVAGVLALSTVGFTFRYAVSGVFDLTYGALMGVAMVLAYLFEQAGINLWGAVILAGASIAVASILVERSVVRPMVSRGANSWVMMIVTFALGLAIEAAVLGIWGPGFNSYALAGGTHHLGGVVVTTDQLWTLVVAAVGTIATGMVLYFTQWGRAVRATSTNPSLAESCGVRVPSVRTLTWLVSGLMCGIGGVLVAIQIGSFTYSSWEQFFPLVIAAAIVGGVGRNGGAVAGALLIGLVTALSAALISSAYEDVIALGLLIAVLLVRPRGLFVRAAA
jgi:branched-subunit amino acid ABC-type transport system permease component